MPFFTRDFISCHAKPFEPHLYDDPVMLICSHVFCRSCCLHLAENSTEKFILCPICSIRIPFDQPTRFVTNLISHGTLANMVEQYLLEERHHQLCSSCENNYLNDSNEQICEHCKIENENLKKKILTNINRCEDLLGEKQILSSERIRDETNQLYTTIDQRVDELMENIDKYQEELDDLLIRQDEINENNASKHLPIDIRIVSTLVEPRLCALRNKENFLKDSQVEKEIKRLTDEADRQIRLLKHRSDIVPSLYPPTQTLSENLLGELHFKSLEINSKTSSMINACGDTFLLSIPPKLPMWTVTTEGLPTHLCVYPLGKSMLIFSCSSQGVLSFFTYLSPVTYDSPRYVRSLDLFPREKHFHIQSFTVFNRFILVHLQSRNNNGLLYFFTHDGILEHEPIQLFNPIRQYLADENRLWAIDSITQTIFSHSQPLITQEITSKISKREQFVSFNSQQTNFIPIRLAVNQELLAILNADFQQVFIYNKISREQIFTSHFGAGHGTKISDIGLFSRDQSLLLKFDWSSDEHVKRSLFIHFNTKNQTVGRIEGKHCLSMVIGPNKEILIGFNLRTGLIRCYM